jgi:tetratricopeptide (TPR) repeat protein
MALTQITADEALDELVGYHLIERVSRPDMIGTIHETISLHSVVASWVRQSSEEEMVDRAYSSLSILAHNLRSSCLPTKSQLGYHRSLAKYVKACLRHIREFKNPVAFRQHHSSDHLIELVHYFSQHRMLKESRELLEEILESKESGLYIESGTHRAQAMLVLGETYRSMSQWDKAKDILTRVSEGVDLTGIDRINCKFELAMVQRGRGHYAQSEGPLREVIQEFEALPPEIGRQHAMCARNSLGNTLNRLKRFEDAENTFTEALIYYRTENLEHDPDYLRAWQNLGLCYKEQDRLVDAREVFEQVVVESIELQGCDNRSTLKTMSNLADVAKRQGDFGVAEVNYKLVVEGLDKTMGSNDSSTKAARRELADFEKEVEIGGRQRMILGN